MQAVVVTTNQHKNTLSKNHTAWKLSLQMACWEAFALGFKPQQPAWLDLAFIYINTALTQLLTGFVIAKSSSFRFKPQSRHYNHHVIGFLEQHMLKDQLAQVNSAFHPSGPGLTNQVPALAGVKTKVSPL